MKTRVSFKYFVKDCRLTLSIILVIDMMEVMFYKDMDVDKQKMRQ